MKKILIELINFKDKPAVLLPDGDIFYQSQAIGELLMHLDILGLDADHSDGLDNVVVEFDTKQKRGKEKDIKRILK